MRHQVHSIIYTSLLCLLAVFMTTSVFFTNLVWVLLFANWAFEWNWREKFADFRHNHLLHAFLILFAVHLLWLIGNENITYGIFDIQKKLPLLAIPLVVLTTPAPNKRSKGWIAFFYVGTVIVVSFIGLVRYLTIPDLPYREIVPYISHIRFGLNICLSLVVLAYVAMKERRTWLTISSIVVSLWLLAFLLLIHSYTSFVILLVTPAVLLIAYRRRLSRGMRITTTTAIVALFLFAFGLTAYYCYDYYHLKPLSTQPAALCTPNGNPYLHRNDGLIENGNYVHHYVCEQEMRIEWAKLSNYPFDSITPVGYTVYPALLRYLNGMGVTKDSLGMTHLTAADVQAIEKGIANPVYLRHGPRKMIYVLCYEYENYRCYNSVSNFTMLQRFELWRNGWHVLWQHPLLGVGTGDVVAACHERLDSIHSPLADTQMHAHNQYLTFLIAFGWLGFLAIVISFVFAISKSHSCRHIIFTAFLCIVLISFLSEDTLETLAGIVFVAFGLSMLSRRGSYHHNH